MKKASALFLLILILFGLAAQLRAGPTREHGGRCLCLKTQPKLSKHAVVSQSEIFYPSPSCTKTEIVITLRNGWKGCLDPEGKQGQKILRGQKLKPKSRKIQKTKGKQQSNKKRKKKMRKN